MILARGGKIEPSFIQQLASPRPRGKKSRAYGKEEGKKERRGISLPVARNDGLRAARRVEPGLIVH